ncbi:MAG: DNA repair protein RadC [Bacteroidales bacterium]|jgi:DNA repair protein RadC|nr:DNA repair protein RadC [Bacteroidales bacterium]
MENYSTLTIKDWAVEDRPREKLLKKGVQTLSDAEIIALLIGSGSRNESAVELSKKVLKSANNNLNELGKLNIPDLTKLKGIGEAKAITILAALELGRRRKGSEIIIKKKITQSKDIFELFQPILGDLPHEEFWILLLNRSNRIIEKFKISQGGISGTVIDIKIILKQSIEKLASSIILCHNHPSGNINPSTADDSITEKLKKGAELLDIQVLDHIIIADIKYYSYADDGKF